MEHYVLSMRHDLRVDQQPLQVLDVGAGQFQSVDLGQLPCGGIGGHQLAELVESRVDGVHSLTLALVGLRSLANVLHAGLATAVRVLVAALVRARAASTAAAGAPVVRCVAVLACRLIPALAIGRLRGGRLGVGVVIVDVVTARGAVALPLRTWSREARGRVAQGLHWGAHDCFKIRITGER